MSADEMCGDYPAPCNCDDPETHDGAVTAADRPPVEDARAAEVLAAHQRQSIGMTASSPDHCSCGEAVPPEPDLTTSGPAPTMEERRYRAFATHQAAALAAARADRPSVPRGEQPCRHCGSCDGPPSCPDCDHADRPPVTDNARAVREAAMNLYRAMRRANPDAWAEVDEVEDWAYWDDIVRTAQVTLAAGRAETTTEDVWDHGYRAGLRDASRGTPGESPNPYRAETTTATDQALAEAWAEGHRTGWEHCQDGNYGNDHWDDPTPNPYAAAGRAETTTAHECDSGDFDRTICDCGAMHSYCTICGTRQDDCPHGTTTATPPGLTVSEDGSVLNWQGVNYVPQRAETTTATTEDALDSLPYFTFEDDDVYPDEEFVRKADVARLLATARTRPTREQIAEHLRQRAIDDEAQADRLDTDDGPSADEWDRWYDEHLTVSHQIDGKSLRIEGRPEAIADAVLALWADQPTRDDLARAIASGYEPDHPTPNRHDYRAADAVLALLRGGA